MSTAIYNELTDLEKRQVKTFGCTMEQMREAIEESITFRFHGPAMVAMSLMSDAQEHINDEFGEVDWMRREDARQAINRAKWVLATYVKQERV